MMQSSKSKNKLLLPDYIAKSVAEIDFAFLKKQGIKACFFDLDHTILSQGTSEVSNTILEQLLSLNLKVYIATNRKYSEDLDKISRQIHAAGIMHSTGKGVFKPRRAYYDKLIALAGTAPKNIVLIGDRIIQDIYGANRAGARSLLVSKFGPVKWWDRLLSIPDIVLPYFFRGRYDTPSHDSKSKNTKNHVLYSRNPIYVFYALGAILLLIFCFIATDVRIGPVEHALFNVLYFLPSWLAPLFIAVTFFGSLAAATLVSLFFVIKLRFDIALRVFVATGVAYLAAMYLKTIIERGRPDALLDYVVPRITVTGFASPSSYAAVSVAYGVTLALYAPRAYRRWVLLAIVLIGCSRIYLGVNLPLDVVAG